MPKTSLHLCLAVAAIAFVATSSNAMAQQTYPSSSSSTAAATTSATNTTINQRDRSNATKTPMDQPNDRADIKVAAAVRKAIIRDKSLSMDAHNVKLVAANGVVTLRGPVANMQEKTKIASLAAAVAGVHSVDNQLDIKH